MSEIWADIDNLTSILLGEEYDGNNFQVANGVENTALYDNSGVKTTLHAGGRDGFFPSNYPAGQFFPIPNSSSLCPTTQQPNVGLVDRAAQLDGVAQSQPPEEDIQDVPPAKKRRITMQQVQQRLEESFNEKSRLEPNKKDQLAEELGLDPKQVEVWFQNRRARSKGKILKAEYCTLKDHYDSLKDDYNRLLLNTQLLKNKASMLSTEIKLKKEEVYLRSMNGFISSDEGNKLLMKPGLPTLEEDSFRGLNPPSMEFVFGFGQPERDVFDSALDEDFDFLLSGMDNQSPFSSSKLGF